MGRTSKFSFPLPGRKRPGSSKSGSVKEQQPPPSFSHVSKAQRILGSGSLNIDSPTGDEDYSFRGSRPPSSGMSIAISESTQEDEAYASGWDGESSVLPRAELHGKASSTILGRRFDDEVLTDSSSVNRRVRNENSSSTLRSHYDRQKSPLAVSQQTSASSARDLALRKGFPPVTGSFPRSPLLEMEMAHQDGELYTLREDVEILTTSYPSNAPSKKKPARLDLSRLFSSKSRKEARSPLTPGEYSRPLSVMSMVSESSQIPDQNRQRKLSKAPSKSKSSGKQEPRPLAVTRESANTLHELYDNYEKMPYESRTSRQIPAQTVEQKSRRHKERSEQSSRRPQTRPETVDPAVSKEFMREVQKGLVNPVIPWDKQSIASNSSRNTRTSKRTSTSLFSDSDLRNNSVLSLSSGSDSDEDRGDRSVHGMATSPRSKFSRSSNVERPQKPASMSSSRTRERSVPKPLVPVNGNTPSRLSRIQDGNFLTIPLPSPGSNRISGPWAVKKEKADLERASRHTSVSTQRSSVSQLNDYQSSQEPSPPPSPGSIMSSNTTRSSRLMAVTKQEEALLEALRQKRAIMREKIIEEHERKSPPANKTDFPTPPQARIGSSQSHRPTVSSERSRQKDRDSSATLRGASRSESNRTHDSRELCEKRDVRDNKRTKSKPKTSPKEQILLYLDRPIAETRDVDLSEPSPDLSDFLSFGSDEDDDATPRTSWIVGRNGQDRMALMMAGELARPDSMASPNDIDAWGRADGAGYGNGYVDTVDSDERDDSVPPTPRSAARLSAVGPPKGYPVSNKSRRATGGYDSQVWG